MKSIISGLLIVGMCQGAVVDATVRGGLGRIGAGVEDVAGGAVEVVTSPFRVNEDSYEDDQPEQPKKKNEKKKSKKEAKKKKKQQRVYVD